MALVNRDGSSLDGMRCANCGAQAATRCSACGKLLCKDHDVFDDPYHSGGLLHRPAHWCKECFSKQQGMGAAVLIMIIMVALGAFIAWMILSPP
jgi:hypothetical protein